MGQIIIEIPQNGVHIYRIQDLERARKLISDIEQIVVEEREEADEDILGVWSDEPEPITKAAKQ